MMHPTVVTSLCCAVVAYEGLADAGKFAARGVNFAVNIPHRVPYAWLGCSADRGQDACHPVAAAKASRQDASQHFSQVLGRARDSRGMEDMEKTKVRGPATPPPFQQGV
jgi:hypothetical protein